MKVVYLVHQFYPEFYSGTEKFVLNLAGMTQQAGNRVKVITYSFYEDLLYDRRRGKILCKEFIYRGIPVLAIRHTRLPEDLHHTLENEELSEIASDVISEEHPDVVHVGHPMRMGPLIRALPPLGIPYLLTLTDFFLVCPKVILTPSRQPLCTGPEQGGACGRLCPELESYYIVARLESAKKIIFGARAVFAPSVFVAGIFGREFPGLALRVAHHGLSYYRIKRNSKSYASHDRVVFCYAGSLNPHKGVHLLIEAFNAMRSGDPLLKLYGSGPDQQYVSKLKALAGKNEHVEFCGLYSEDQTGEILSNVDVVVVPSLCYENYPMTLHEALACNVPVVATNLGGMAEKIQDGVNGFLFKMGDSQELQAVLERIVKDPSVLNPLKRNIDSMVIPGIEQEAYSYSRVYETIKRKPGLKSRET